MPPSETVGSPAPVTGPTTGELHMILKTMHTFVPDLPKLEPGEPATRARRFQQLVLHVSQALCAHGISCDGMVELDQQLSANKRSRS